MKQSRLFAVKLFAILTAMTILLTSCASPINDIEQSIAALPADDIEEHIDDSPVCDTEEYVEASPVSDVERRIAALENLTISEENRINVYVGGAPLPCSGIDRSMMHLGWYHRVLGEEISSIQTLIIDYTIGTDAFRGWLMEFGEFNTTAIRHRGELNLITLIDDFNLTAGDIISAQEATFNRPMAEIDAFANWARYGIDMGFSDPGNEPIWRRRYTLSDLEAIFSGSVAQIWAVFPGYGVVQNNRAYSPEWILSNIVQAVREEQIPMSEILRILEKAEGFPELSEVVAQARALLEAEIPDPQA